jgi:predicted amidohydrolase YtcJ
MPYRRFAAVLAASIAVAGLFGFIARTQKGDTAGPADLVILNGKVYPAGGGAFAEAVAVRGNSVLRVGTNQEVKGLAGNTTTVIDARGGAVVPGLNDSHLHVISGGLSLQQALLGEATSLDALKRVILEFAKAHPDRPWVLGRGWTYMALPGGLPTRQQLDEVVPDRPAVMVAYDGHTSWVNSRALKLAGITASTSDPGGGSIGKDPKTGEPTGVLKESAQGLVRRLLPASTREDRLNAVRAAVSMAHRFGVTSVQNAGSSPEDMELFDALRKSGELTLRIYSAMSVEPGFGDADADRIDRVRDRKSVV